MPEKIVPLELVQLELVQLELVQLEIVLLPASWYRKRMKTKDNAYSMDDPSKFTVLVVDDVAANIDILLETLSDDYDIRVAMDGESALEIVDETRPDLILLDIMMPGIDGFEVCRRLKSTPATDSIPIIFLSALDDTGAKVKGLEMGAVDYVSKPFRAEEIIARVNTHLTIHRLNREVAVRRDMLEHELRVVSDVQRTLLPKHPPGIAGLALATHYETSLYAGGDYYDMVKLPGGQWGFLVADAEGHSARAAVMMAMTCALFRSSPAQADPDKLLASVNRNLCQVNDYSFVTAIYSVYDETRRTLRMARAGHTLPMVYRHADRKAVELDCEGVLPLGLDDYGPVPVTEISLARGDRILFYTDGITERFGPGREQYGEQRLLKKVEAAGSVKPEDIIRDIMADVERFAAGRPPDDDQALLMMVAV